MTVQELINKLQTIENKNLQVSVLYEVWDEYQASWESDSAELQDILVGKREILLDGIRPVIGEE
ncbi:MAG: hypothetical protein ACRCZ0_01695 [Cetobacterium sp.]